jgi:hypothetical protein
MNDRAIVKVDDQDDRWKEGIGGNIMVEES